MLRKLLNWQILSILLLVHACARIAPPPGKPEIVPPSLDIEHPNEFTGFPIFLRISVKDASGIKRVILKTPEGRLYSELNMETKDTTLEITLDTLYDMGPDSTWKGSSIVVEASDIHDNLSRKSIFIANPNFVDTSRTTSDQR